MFPEKSRHGTAVFLKIHGNPFQVRWCKFFQNNVAQFQTVCGFSREPENQLSVLFFHVMEIPFSLCPAGHGRKPEIVAGTVAKQCIPRIFRARSPIIKRQFIERIRFQRNRSGKPGVFARCLHRLCGVIREIPFGSLAPFLRGKPGIKNGLRRGNRQNGSAKHC